MLTPRSVSCDAGWHVACFSSCRQRATRRHTRHGVVRLLAVGSRGATQTTCQRPEFQRTISGCIFSANAVQICNFQRSFSVPISFEIFNFSRFHFQCQRHSNFQNKKLFSVSFETQNSDRRWEHDKKPGRDAHALNSWCSSAANALCVEQWKTWSSTASRRPETHTIDPTRARVCPSTANNTTDSKTCKYYAVTTTKKNPLANPKPKTTKPIPPTAGTLRIFFL